MQTQTSASTHVLEVSHFSVHWILLDRASPDVSSLQHASQWRPMRPGVVMAAGAGVWHRGLNDLGLTPCPGCEALTEVMPSLEA